MLKCPSASYWRQRGGRRAALPPWLFTLKQAGCGFKFVITVLPCRVCQKCTTKVTQYISWPRGHHFGSWLLHVTRTKIGRGYVSSFKYFYIYLNVLLVKTWWKICLFLQRSLSWQLKGSARWRPWRSTSSFSWLTCRSLVGKMNIWKSKSKKIKYFLGQLVFKLKYFRLTLLACVLPFV